MEKNLSDARRLYLEHYGGTLVMNNYLKAALFLASSASVGGVILCFTVFSWAKNQRPMIVRIDEVGRATAINYTGFAYTPQAPELRYFLAQFVTLHYSRLLGAIEERFQKSLFYLDAKLSQAVIEEEKKSQSLARFVHEAAEETDVEITNIALQDLRSRPMKASVDFEKVFYNRGDRRELRRERYAGYFEFTIQQNIPTSFVLVNPLGITITYFRVDAAFK